LTKAIANWLVLGIWALLISYAGVNGYHQVRPFLFVLGIVAGSAITLLVLWLINRRPGD